jgi:hypothetical protein
MVSFFFFFLEGTIFSVFSFFYLSKYQKINARQQENVGFSPAWRAEAGPEPGREGKCRVMHIPGVGIVWESERVAFIWARPSAPSYPLKPHCFGSSCRGDPSIWLVGSSMWL